MYENLLQVFCRMYKCIKLHWSFSGPVWDHGSVLGVSQGTHFDYLKFLLDTGVQDYKQLRPSHLSNINVAFLPICWGGRGDVWVMVCMCVTMYAVTLYLCLSGRARCHILVQRCCISKKQGGRRVSYKPVSLSSSSRSFYQHQNL